MIIFIHFSAFVIINNKMEGNTLQIIVQILDEIFSQLFSLKL